ncbi:MAG: hypothetical protein ACK56F_19515, partial [bacterium]
EISRARGNSQVRVFATAMECAEECEHAGPCTVATVHRIGMSLMIGAKLFEETVEGVVLLVERTAGHHAAIFGVKQEDAPHEHGEKTFVNLVRLVGENPLEQTTFGAIVRGLKPAQQFERSVDDLL